MSADKKYSAAGETKAVEGSVLWNELALKGKLISRIEKLDEPMIEFSDSLHNVHPVVEECRAAGEEIPKPDEKYLDAFLADFDCRSRALYLLDEP